MNNDDDWMRKYFANKQAEKQLQQVNNNAKSNWKDANINQHLLQKALTAVPQQNNINTCMIIEGTEIYRNLSVNGFYPKYPIVRSGGTYTSKNNQAFEIKGTVKCVLVQGNESVDFSNINENSSCVVELMQLNAPFIGTILVKKENVVGFADNNKKMLMG